MQPDAARIGARQMLAGGVSTGIAFARRVRSVLPTAPVVRVRLGKVRRLRVPGTAEPFSPDAHASRLTAMRLVASVSLMRPRRHDAVARSEAHPRPGPMRPPIASPPLGVAQRASGPSVVGAVKAPLAQRPAALRQIARSHAARSGAVPVMLRVGAASPLRALAKPAPAMILRAFAKPRAARAIGPKHATSGEATAPRVSPHSGSNPNGRKPTAPLATPAAARVADGLELQNRGRDTETDTTPMALESGQLERWLDDHLARAVVRPQSGLSAMDERLTPVFPGAPSS